MGKIMKSGKVVLLLSGRYAGRKAVIVKSYDDGTGDRQYGHALVIGMERYPRPVTKNMSKTKLKRRSKIKPFIKVANYNHMMPTRYSVDINFTTQRPDAPGGEIQDRQKQVVLQEAPVLRLLLVSHVMSLLPPSLKNTTVYYEK